jgi:hypothetical protein
MRPFLYALTFSLGACLLLPAAARGKGVLGGGGYDPPPEPTKEEIAAEKRAEQISNYFIGSIAAVVALAVIVQFVREVRGNAPPIRVVSYSARTDSYDGTSRYGGTSSYDGTASAEVDDDVDDDADDDYDGGYGSDF